ncbi:MAG TPA: hypothetical protein PL009_07145 [Flavipsychrobacter sp.]|nr:hypothetical protein [Flavipsychrobacter sp.]
MRKAVAILVLASYMLCAFGINFSFHHCKGKLKYVNVHSDKKKPCCKGKKMPKGCCKSLKVAFKKADDKAQSFLSFTPQPVAISLPTLEYFLVNHKSQEFADLERSNYHLRPPPLRTGSLPLYIVYSVYRI